MQQKGHIDVLSFYYDNVKPLSPKLPGHPYHFRYRYQLQVYLKYNLMKINTLHKDCPKQDCIKIGQFLYQK